VNFEQPDHRGVVFLTAKLRYLFRCHARSAPPPTVER
jgi:hypothetical protein